MIPKLPVPQAHHDLGAGQGAAQPERSRTPTDRFFAVRCGCLCAPPVQVLVMAVHVSPERWKLGSVAGRGLADTPDILGADSAVKVLARCTRTLY